MHALRPRLRREPAERLENVSDPKLTDLQQVALCTLQADEWRASKFFGDTFRELEAMGFAETRLEGELTSGKLTAEGAVLAEPLRKKGGS